MSNAMLGSGEWWEMKHEKGMESDHLLVYVARLGKASVHRTFQQRSEQSETWTVCGWVALWAKCDMGSVVGGQERLETGQGANRGQIPPGLVSHLGPEDGQKTADAESWSWRSWFMF